MTEIRYRVRQRGARWGENKISSFIILIGRQSILRYIILDGRGQVLQEILDEIENSGRIDVRIRIHGTHVGGRWCFRHGDPRRLPAKRSLRRETWIVGTRLAIGKWPNCSRTVRMCPVNPIRKSLSLASPTVFSKAHVRGFNATRNQTIKMLPRDSKCFQTLIKY